MSGASPVVDTSSNVKSQVLNREVLDAVPSAKTIQSLGQLVVGVNLSSPDVGGSRAMQQTYFSVHGVGASGTMVMVDGLVTNGLMGDGAVQAYHNEAMIQEAVYQTAGGAAVVEVEQHAAEVEDHGLGERGWVCGTHGFRGFGECRKSRGGLRAPG
mgnify:CR=1 FL=1